MKRALTLILTSIFFSGAASADGYPVSGAWAFVDQTEPKLTAQTCQSYLTNPKEVIGHLIVFSGKTRTDFNGGYWSIETVTNVAIRPLAPNSYQVTDRYYADEEGGKKPGFKQRVYRLTIIDENRIQIREGKYEPSQFAKCVGLQTEFGNATLNGLLEKIHQECADRWGSAGSVASCVIEREQEYGRELASLYKAALARSRNDAELLRDSQRSWLRYQDLNCKFHRQRWLYEGDMISRASAASCLLRTTLQRLEEMRALAGQ